MAAMVCLAAVNVGALCAIGLFGLFVTAASMPLAMAILEKVDKE